jgi:hypothetical protein
MIRSYRELRRFTTFEDRFRYLSIGGVVGRSTFGFDRWISQQFYESREWKTARRDTIARDLGCDLGMEDREIHERLLIHHMNPISVDDIRQGDSDIVNPEFLITTTYRTHNAIHFGDERLLTQPYVERRAGDTKLW